jgi:hypothetical protein
MTMRPAVRRAIVVLVIAAALALSWLGTVDTVAKRSTEAGLQRALATYAVARGFNAIISLAMSASVNVQFIAGMQVSPGALLDPLDDLIEQFSVVMLAATVSFAAQRLLIEIGGSWPVSLLLTFVCAAWLALRWQRRIDGPLGFATPARAALAARMALALICLRFAVPAVALASEATYQFVMAGTYEAAQAKVKAVEAIEPAEVPAPQSRMDRIRRWLSDKADVAEKIDALKARFDAAIEHLVRLTAVFVVQTIVLPLLFLWLIVRLYRTLLPPRYPKRLEMRVGDEH